MKYQVYCKDILHPSIEDERSFLDEFDSLDMAIHYCMKVVDESLIWLYNQQPEITTELLFVKYCAYGEQPFIKQIPSRDTEVFFSPWNYAKERVNTIIPEISISHKYHDSSL